MIRRLLSATLAAAAFALLPAVPAAASSMPKADFGGGPTLGLGLGNGVSLAFDAPLNREMSLGASIGTGLVYSRLNSVDIRFLYKLLHGSTGRQPWIDLLVGAQGGGPSWSLGGFEPIVGVAGAYGFTSQLTLRMNLVVGVMYRNAGLSGIELGYKFNPRLEGTIGGNGRGDFIGLKFAI